MDLSGHDAFAGAFRASERDRHGPDGESAKRSGARLLMAAWASLSGGRVESVTVHLRSGLLVEGVLQLRIEGLIAGAATRPGQWTHMFAIEDVVLVQMVPRGGKR